MALFWGALDAGDRPLTRRLDDQGPRAHRRHWTPLCADADARQCQRREGRPRAARACRTHGYLLGDKGYDADRLRRSLREVGVTPVIPGRRNRTRAIRYDQQRYRGRHLIENAFCRLKDFRRVATRYDKLAANFLSAVALATAVAFWP
jgi:transposase